MEKLRISEIYSDAQRILMAVETVTVHHGNSGLGRWLHGHIEMSAILVLDRLHISAYNSEAKSISIEQLRKDIPELDTMIPEMYERISSGTKS